MYRNKILILFISSSVLINLISTSPVFEPSENVVDDTVADDSGFEKASDGFQDMNDFNFEPEGGMGGQNKEQENVNQSDDQIDEDGPSISHNSRERPSLSGDLNKINTEEQENNNEENLNDQSSKLHDRESNKKYQDGNENSARSLDQFESFDKEMDNFDKNDRFNDNEQSDNQLKSQNLNSGEEQSLNENNSPIPPTPMQIDEPILVNGGPMIPIPLQDKSLMVGRSNSEEGEGGKYDKSMSEKSKKSHKEGALGYHNYKFLPSGIKYIKHEKPGVSRTRIAQPNLASLTVDPSLAAETEDELDQNTQEYMNQWISNFERNPSLLNALSDAVSNINYGFGDSKKK